MKKLLLLLFLLPLFSIAQEDVFPSEEELFRIKNNKGYTARIDGLFFNSREDNNCVALIQNSNLVSINLLGNSTKDKSGKFYKQSITLECSMVNDKLTPLRVVYDFAGKKYLGHEADVKIEVANLEWNASKTGFALTGKFESTVKRPFDDGLMVVMNIKCRMADLDVVVSSPEKTVAEQ